MNFAESLWGDFIVTLMFGFLTGLELKAYLQKYHQSTDEVFFGTVRTFAFTAIAGFSFFLLDFWLFLVGFIGLSALYMLFYSKALTRDHGSVLLYWVWALVYVYGALAQTQPFWVLAAIFVTIVIVLNAKQTINSLAEKISGDELTTLAKLILLSGIILPLLPNEILHPWLPVSPFKIWLAVVVVSSVSYLGYVAQKYLFKNQGILVTGIFGGLYSSTATTVVLSRKSKDVPRMSYKMTAAIMLATAMMYLRLWAIAAVFQWKVAQALAPYLGIFALLSLLIVFAFIQIERRNVQSQPVMSQAGNPLELKVAFIFAGLFVLMAVITQFVTQFYGGDGLRYLSLIVGFTDIDPFVLSLLNGSYSADTQLIASGILIAAGSNNLLKALYAWILGEPIAGKYSAIGLGSLGILTIATGWLMI
ncbi:hypothetical protein THMIRHAS_01470 [Thiosulfatimonas sediminis]|uniref:DUF4010 domain-containing protein n=1 Tax=Thiosulfatimonas sediminis TaxID=2675054 RepID=A0A6F8PRW2_9GAMM|nr:DUF4010 domain-containing protein [Thiosulfatimonas sediminis]BBP44774.1 hypothetical protein THMIRHAS_01470 [Thiosulfatimonas sediminis]